MYKLRFLWWGFGINTCLKCFKFVEIIYFMINLQPIRSCRFSWTCLGLLLRLSRLIKLSSIKTVQNPAFSVDGSETRNPPPGWYGRYPMYLQEFYTSQVENSRRMISEPSRKTISPGIPSISRTLRLSTSQFTLSPQRVWLAGLWVERPPNRNHPPLSPDPAR